MQAVAGPRASSAPPRELPTAPQKNPALERRRGSTVTSRIREREAEFAKQVKDREEQISRLKERLKVLSQKLATTKEPRYAASRDMENDQREDGAELQSIIKQVTKERMQLERHLQIANDSLQRNSGVDLTKYLSLEQTNSHLRQQLDSLDLLQQQHKLVEIQYREKEEACRELMNTLKYKSALCEDLETQLAKVIEKNTELTIANSDLQKKVLELKDVNEECLNLKSNLLKVENECVSAKTEVSSLSGKVRNLESVLDEMHKAAENRREIERQHREALENLKRKQDEVETTATKKQEDFINQLKVRIEDLEAEKRSQNERHQELILEMAELKKYGGSANGPDSIASDIEQPSDNLEIDEIMAKLEQDNKFLADLEKQRKAKSGKQLSPSSGVESGDSPTSSTTLHRACSAITDSGFLSQSSLNGGGSPTYKSSGSLNKLPGVTGADKINLLNGHGYTSAPSSSVAVTSPGLNVSKDGMMEMPGKGWRFVYVARYSYDPFQHSPNDSPEAELQVNAGDYILVWGEADEDGFFDGELLDGRRGLVPSNFVERLENDDLADFHQQVVLGLGDCDDSVCTSIPQDLDVLSSDEGAVGEYLKPLKPEPLKRTSLPQYASCTDLEMTEDEGDGASLARKVPPAPRQLTMEAQHNKSIVIEWNAPDVPVDRYEVVVDGIVHSTVKNDCKATISGLDLSVIHRISVKSVLEDSRRSHEPACTMVVGKDAPLGPTVLRSTRTTSTSATVSWIPSNTNFLHSISVNGVDVKTVRPGVFRHTLAGLLPNTAYRVTVRAKNIKAAPYMAGNIQLSSNLEIRTLPKGLPDAPVDVQVEAGPCPGTLLVSWLPVTINPAGTSNGAPVTGYIVYGDGQRLMDVESGTADQAVVELGGRTDLRFVTVRTKSSKDAVSNESEIIPIPQSIYGKANDLHNISVDASDSDSEGEVIQKLRKDRILTQQQPTQPREVLIQYNGYPDSDVGPSELSDIAEEPEDGLTTSEESGTNTPQMTPSALRPGTTQWKPDDVSDDGLATAAVDEPEAGRWNKVTSSQFQAQPFFPPPLEESVKKKATTVQITTQAAEAAAAPPAAKKIRIFVALFDYDPPTMSPNPDACDEELPFREGQLIRVYGEKDADGFYFGEAGRHTGFVPCNMVSEVQVEDDRVADELFKEQSSTIVTSPPTAAKSALKTALESDDRWGDIYEDMPAKRKLALYDYDPSELSPNVDAEVELSFRTGDVLLVYGDMDDDGFYMGELNGRRGLVPSNFLTDVPPGYMVVDSSKSQQPRVLGQQRRW